VLLSQHGCVSFSSAPLSSIHRRCMFQTRKNYYVDLRHSVCEKEGSSLGTALFRFFIICPQRPPELTILTLGKQTTWSCYRRGQKPTDYGACLKESCLRNCTVAYGGLISHAYPTRICTCDGAGASSNEPTISQQQYSRAMNRKKSTQRPSIARELDMYRSFLFRSSLKRARRVLACIQSPMLRDLRFLLFG